MAKSAIIGMIFKRGVQRYECVAIRPHQRIDGRMTKLAVWITTCPECGEAFEVVCTTSMNRGPGNRRCPLHRAPGKKVKELEQVSQRQNHDSCANLEGASGIIGAADGSVPGDNKTASGTGGAA
jgi:hypothetical protein